MIGELKFQISDLAKNSDPPWDLLLLADPSREMIDRYLSESEVFVGELQGKLIGVLVLLPLSDGIVEIKNLAVDETFQGKGFGKQLLRFAIQYAKQKGLERLLIATGNSSMAQLTLYQSLGFELFEVDWGFFERNYPEPIVENGIVCKHLMKLQIVFD